MNTEPARAWTVLAKCAIGLAVIALIAVLGASNTDGRGADGHAATAASARTGQVAQAHRKQVFDERRARFEGGTGHHRIASEAMERVSLWPLALR